MEWTYPLSGGRGVLTVRQAGRWAEVNARLQDDGRGLYKGWLTGRGGELLLGTFLPQGGELRLARTLDRAELERRGFWPPEGAAARLTFAFGESPQKQPERGPEGFVRARPDQVLGDTVLRTSGGDCPLWVRKAGEQTLVLLPFRTDRPFPLLPAFCLMRVVEREGRHWLALRLDGRGWPILPPPTGEELV